MTGPESGLARTALGASRAMVVLGAVLVMACVGYLTYTWWVDGRWVWVVLGIVLIVVNIALLITSLRKPRLPTPSTTPSPNPNPNPNPKA